MASLTSSSHRSSSSYRSSSRYSTSSSYHSDGSSDSLDALFEPFCESANCSSLFGDECPGESNCLSPFNKHRRSSYVHLAPVGGAVTGQQTGAGGRVQCLGDTYYTSVDVAQFEPHDIVVMAYNHHVVIQAQKILDDGSVSDTFSHKSLFPEDMDPLTISGTLNPYGTLLVSVRRTAAHFCPEPLCVPTYYNETHL